MLSVSFTLPSFAQRYNILHFTNENVLPQNSANRVAFDRHGYTWISTQFGLVRYDGVHFRTYNTFNTPAIKNNRFSFLASDVHKDIYALDGNDCMYQIADTGFIIRTDLQYKTNCFAQAGFENLGALLAKKNSPLTAHNPSDKKDPWLSFFHLDTTRFYFSTADYAGYFNGEKLYAHKLAGVENSFIARGLFFVMLANGTYNVYKGDALVNEGLRFGGDILKDGAYNKTGINTAVFAPSVDSNAYIYLNKTLYSVNGDEKHITTSLVCSNIDAKGVIMVTYNAATGIYYLCSQVEGLYILMPKKFTSLVTSSLQSEEGLVNCHYAVVETKKNTIFSANGFLYKDSSVEGPLLNNISWYSFFKDHLDHIWFERLSQLYETDEAMNLLHTYPLNEDEIVKCIREDGKGRIWIATKDKIGIMNKARFQIFKDNIPLQYGTIESFVIQDDSLIWIGGQQGLASLNINSRALTAITALKGSYVRAIKPDADTTLWIGTYGQGFYRYKNGRLVKFPTDKNGYLSIAHCFMEDHKGFFWIPTNRGLFQVSKQDLNDYADGKTKEVYYHYYDKSDGFETNEFNGGCNPCGIRISDGSFIIPSINGLVKFVPEAIDPVLPSGEIFIDKITADSLVYPSSRSFQLKSGFHQLAFEISSVYYGNRNNNNIEYRLKGFSDTWYPLNEDGVISITTLPHGNFELQLRRLAGFGRENYVYKNIAFKVAPGMYDTVWFRLLVLVFMAVLIWMGFRVRYNLLQKQKKVLQRQVAERTAALQQSVEELHESENALYSSIQQKEKITSILLHDLKSPLRFLTLVSDHIHSEIDHGNKDELKKLTQDMMNSSRRISMVTDEFLAWLLTDNKDYPVNNEIIFLKPITDEIAGFFGEMVESNHNILQVDVKENIQVIADERLLRAILRNLIDNANKHTRNGTISLIACNGNGTTEIKVSDTGQGMTEEQLQSFSNADTNTLGFSLHIGNQLGSRIIRDFINKLGGSLTVASEKGKGTSITLFLKS